MVDLYIDSTAGDGVKDNNYFIYNRFVYVLNRAVWIPYVTAYDWLRFHREILNGSLTMGRSIGLLHMLYDEPRMRLDRMVYAYQFGASPGGVGSSNTVFFVDAKLAFGWLGVVAYVLLFTFLAASIFASGNVVLMLSSISVFVVASVSSLTATLLSGGGGVYLILAMLLYRRDESSLVRLAGPPENI